MGEKANYKDGKPKDGGPYIGYYSNGQVDWKGNYKNGEKDGLWNYFNKDGTLERSKTYRNGKVVE